jgi:hypothetical protein
MSLGIVQHSVAVGLTPTTTSTRPRRATGEAVAALLAAMVGMLTLAVVNQLTAAAPGFTAWVCGVAR